MTDAPILEIQALDVHRGATQIVSGVSATLREGESLAVLGRNGAGKTTLAEAIAGVLPRTTGSIRIEGKEVRGFKPHRVAKCGVALVPEQRKLFVNMTVRENLALGAHTAQWWWEGPSSDNFDFVSDVFPRLTILKDRRVGTLSGGEQQMVAIGRALMSRPKLLILDEPSSGLSPVAVENVVERLLSLSGHLCILLFEQSVDVALDLCNRVAILSNGQLIAEGPAEEMAGSDVFVQALFGTTAPSDDLVMRAMVPVIVEGER
jgi:ABC-type branched-subunit amino acid transport system ATPase component